MSEGTKDDRTKPPIFTEVLAQFPRAMACIATIGAYGANRYSSDNWRNVRDGVSRYTNALARHLVSEGSGEVLDPDARFPHAWSVAWNSLARLELMEIEREKNSERT